MIPAGLCQCGCGEKAPIARLTNTRRGIVKGQPQKYIFGHRGRLHTEYVEDENGCWIWQGRKDRLGYCRLWVDGALRLAHRHVYERERGPIPAGLDLDHLCRVPSCVNPAHLEPVTHAENVRRGANTRLSVDDVRAIRGSLEKHRVLAERFGVSVKYIGNLRSSSPVWKGIDASAARRARA
jgi:hypothetical protein